eukprot:GILI01025947.1.p1 GENE.GILI01025947.1~~GILI01025947.1.p1  ORF type:complete len:353 (+),score=117.68 GILI01025947.1:72-1130(+)
MTSVQIDTYAAMAIVDHCKRINACVTEPPTIIGFLIGITKVVGKETIIRVTNILPTSKPELFAEVKAYITSDSRERIVGVYNTRGVDASVTSVVKADQFVYLAVTLPTPSNLQLELTATRIIAKNNAEGKRELTITEAPLQIASTEVGANVVLATVMGQLFPEVAQELKNRDPLSVETYAVEEKVGRATAENLDDFADHRLTLPHHISIADLEHQLADLAKIASEGAKGKNVGGADPSIAKEIAALRQEAKQCLADLESDGSQQYAKDKFEDVLTAKYIAELSKARLATIAGNIVEAKEVARRYENTRSNYRSNNNSNGTRTFDGRGGSYRGRGGARGSRGGRGGRGAARAE